MIRYLSLILLIIVFPDEHSHAQIDFAEHIQPIFTNNCVACHGGTSGVTLSSYDATMNSVGLQYGMNVVIPEEPAQSPIVDKISSDNPQHGVRMPEGGPYLSEDEIDAIRQWIEEGANESVETSTDPIAERPAEFRLIGNYPNPFNPSTIIQLELPVSSGYQLTIFSALGTEVYRQNGNLLAGQAELRVNLNRQPSGVYFYRIEFPGIRTGEKILTGRMTLLK
ncbi:hypothetical protein BH23BAC3_BH23BAC3_35420 [soil metagenome]